MDDKYFELLKKQNRLMKVIAGLLVAIFVVMVGTIGIMGPKLNKAIEETNTAVSKLDQVVTELDEADIAGLVKDTKSVVEQSNTGVSEALTKIEEIDIKSLNDAIASLKAVVEPLSKLSLFGN